MVGEIVLPERTSVGKAFVILDTGEFPVVSEGDPWSLMVLDVLDIPVSLLRIKIVGTFEPLEVLLLSIVLVRDELLPARGRSMPLQSRPHVLVSYTRNTRCILVTLGSIEIEVVPRVVTNSRHEGRVVGHCSTGLSRACHRKSLELTLLRQDGIEPNGDTSARDFTPLLEVVEGAIA